MKKVNFLKKVSFLLTLTLVISLCNNFSLVNAISFSKDEVVKSWEDYTLISLGEEVFNFTSNNIDLDGSIRGNGDIDIKSSKLDIIGEIAAAKSVKLSNEFDVIVKENQPVISVSELYDSMINYIEGDIEKINVDKVLFDSIVNLESTVETTENYNINSAILNVNANILAHKDIVISNSLVNSNNTDKVFIASKDGNISISASSMTINGIIYAPNGVVEINTDQLNIQGRIIAKKIIINANTSIIKSSENDLDFIKDEIAPTLTITEPVLAEDSMITEEDKITIKGTAKDNVGISFIEYEVDSEYKKDNNEKSIKGKALGTDIWSIDDLPLDLGLNYITIKAYDKSNNYTQKKVKVKRNNTEIKMSDNVVGVSEEDAQKINEAFLSQEVDDNKTPGYPYDDKRILRLNKNNPISEAIENETFKIGSILYIPPCEYFVLGYSGKLKSYTSKDDYVEFYFDNVDFGDLFNDYISMDIVSELTDKEDILFVRTATGEDVTNLTEEDIVETYGDKFPNAGLQGEELIKYAIPKFEGNSLSFGNTTDVVIYDKDGDKSTTQDQIRLSGKNSYKNLTFENTFDWNATFADWGPKQIKAKLKYDHTNDMAVSFGPKLTMQDVVKMFQNAVDADFKNEASLFGLSVEGVKMTETIPLITMGVRFSPGPSLVPSMSLNGVHGASVSTPYTPIITIMVLMDMSGELSLTAKIGFDNKEHLEKGFNLQHVDYVGVYGGINSNENKGQERYDLPFGRVMDIYDVNSEDSLDLNAPPRRAVKGSVEGKAQLELGLGAGIGFFMMGFMPGMARVLGYVNFSGNGYGKFELVNGQFSSSGELLNLSFETGTKINVSARVKIPLASFESTYSKKNKLFSTGKDSKIKIVLRWSDLPRDLDSHLYTPTNDHIYYGNKIKYKPGTTEKQIQLDYDYTSGYGPETTTIYGPDSHGTYSFYVKDYSNKSNTNSTALSKSRAVVKVYMEDVEVETFVVPTDQIGRTWHVFDYDPAMEKIKSVNKIYNTYNRTFDEKDKNLN